MRVTAASYAEQEDHTDARVRGTKVINNIVIYKNRNKHYSNSCKKWVCKYEIKQKEKDDIIQQIKNLVDARKNMFNDLKTNQVWSV